MCVQETHFNAQKPPSCQHKAFSLYFFANAPQKCKGVCIAIHNTITFQPRLIDTDVNSRYVILTALIDNQKLTLLNLYAPNCHQKQFYSLLMHKILLYDSKQLSLCGDFNEVIDPPIDSKSTHRKCSNALSSLLSSKDVFDAWHSL